jgi:signal transduction histidine kinase
MTMRVTETYENLNNFTSHTTHEIQTPLAVIRLKSELLMQTENLNSEQLSLIESIGDNSRHLSQLNRSLALLFKIDNHHYSSTGDFYPASGILRQLDNLNELIEIKQLIITSTLPADVKLSMDPSLGDILVYNLVKNAIVHNQSGGIVQINLGPGYLNVFNNGPEPTHPTEHYFAEFVKGPESKGLGLGLALVRRICNVSGTTISYTWAEGLHRFMLTWPEKKQ